MDRILVVNVNWVGDVIFSSPIFKALKEKYPHAKISCLGVPRVREVLESIPFIDEIIIFDEKGRHWNPFGKLKLIMQLRQRRFDAAFLLHRSLTRALLVFLAGIPQRIGYDEKKRGMLLTHTVQRSGNQEHRSDGYLNVIESYGILVNDRQSQLNVFHDAEQRIKGMLRSKNVQNGGFLTVINIGGNWNLKRWPKTNFSVLTQRLMDEYHTQVVFSGAQRDRDLIMEVIAPLPSKPAVIAGETNLKELIALLKRADCVISADSGPIHLASGVGTRVIGLFGPTRPEVTGPRGTGEAYFIQHDVGCNREPCYNLNCPDNICMQTITVQDVLEAFKKIRN